VEDGRELFIKLAGEDLEENSSEEKEVQLAIEKLVQKVGGHPLSIEILARSYYYQDLGLEEIEGKMLKSLGLGVVNPEEEYERLRTLEACFQYSMNNLDETLKQLLPKLTLFKSPFPISATSEIFEVDKTNIINLYNRSLLTRIEYDEIYGRIEDPEYLLYNIHPALGNYLQNISDKSGHNLEFEYGEKYSSYYYNLVWDTYNAIGKEDKHLQSLACFNIIFQGETNDFDRAVEIAKDIYIYIIRCRYFTSTITNFG
jgi:hypothetical protein